MKKVYVDGLEIGMKLAQDVFNDQGQMIIAEQTELKESHIDRIKQLGIVYVLISLRSDISQRFKLQADRDEILNAKYQKSVDQFKQLYTNVKINSKIEIKDAETIMMPLLEEIDRGANLIEKIWQIQQNDEYTFEHSVQVSVFSALMGKWLKFNPQGIKELAMAGLLHDIGKCNIPDEILNKAGNLSASEFDIMKNHPILGYMMLVGSKDYYKDPVLQGVLQHHERCDGSGYPSAHVASQIHPYGRIVAVADLYSAMTSDRIYRKKVCPFVVAELLMHESSNGLDKFYVSQFLFKVTQYFIGNYVKLSNDAIGRIIMCERSHPHRPLIKVKDDFIDLITEKDLRIIELLDITE